MRIDKNDEKDISCSMGVTLGRGGVKYEDLFRQADSALYTAKTNGKLCWATLSLPFCSAARIPKHRNTFLK